MNVLRIPARVSQLAAVREFIRDQARRAGAGREVVDDMVQAVDESVTNAIVHGYRGAAGSIEVEVGVVHHALVVHVRDQAPPFDPTAVPEPEVDLPLEQRPFGGMGVFLCRQLTDEMTYRKTEHGNELTLVKRGIGQGGVTC
jgi:serine/threonine-protein kinase RsbW